MNKHYFYSVAAESRRQKTEDNPNPGMDPHYGKRLIDERKKGSVGYWTPDHGALGKGQVKAQMNKIANMQAPEAFAQKVNVPKIMAEKFDKAIVENWIANECFLIKGEVDEVVNEYFNSQLVEIDPKTKKVEPKKLVVAMESFIDDHSLPVVTRLWPLLLRLDDFSQLHRCVSPSEFSSLPSFCGDAVDFRILKVAWFKQWIDKRVSAARGEADEVLSDLIMNYIVGCAILFETSRRGGSKWEAVPRQLCAWLTHPAFLGKHGKQSAQSLVSDLWRLMLSAMKTNGVPDESSRLRADLADVHEQLARAEQVLTSEEEARRKSAADLASAQKNLADTIRELEHARARVNDTQGGGTLLPRSEKEQGLQGQLDQMTAARDAAHSGLALAQQVLRDVHADVHNRIEAGQDLWDFQKKLNTLSQTYAAVQSTSPTAVQSTSPAAMQSTTPAVVQSTSPDVVQSTSPTAVQNTSHAEAAPPRTAEPAGPARCECGKCMTCLLQSGAAAEAKRGRQGATGDGESDAERAMKKMRRQLEERLAREKRALAARKEWFGDDDD